MNTDSPRDRASRVWDSNMLGDCASACNAGDRVRVFSRSIAEWVDGIVAEVFEDKSVRVEYKVAGYWCGKMLRPQSEYISHNPSTTGSTGDSAQRVDVEETRLVPLVLSERAVESIKRAPFQGCRSEMPVDPLKFYVEMDYLWDILYKRDVVLIRARWLLAHIQSKHPKPLPSRQDLERCHPEALAHVGQLRYVSRKLADLQCNHFNRLAKPIVAISHCWLDANHPDPNSALLAELAPAIEAYIQEISEVCGDFCDGAFFFAWCSIHQPYHQYRNGHYRRMENVHLTHDESESHRAALASMDIWYTHAETEVWKVTKYFDGQGHAYEQRGWPTWESTVADLISHDGCVLQFSKDWKDMWAENKKSCDGGSMARLRTALSCSRGPPLVPEEFEKLLADKHFTCGQQDYNLVSSNYRRNFGHAIGFLTELTISSSWRDDELRLLGKSLKHCQALRDIRSLSFDGLSRDVRDLIADGLQHCTNLTSFDPTGALGDAFAYKLVGCLQNCTVLTYLNLSDNEITAVGCCQLTKVLRRFTKIQRFLLGAAREEHIFFDGEYLGGGRASTDYTRIGDVGAEALAQSIVHWCDLQCLSLNGNHISDSGASTLATCLLRMHCCTLVSLALADNRIGDVGTRLLVKSLRLCNDLKKFDLQWNNIGNAGVRALEGLDHCFDLVLWLANNPMDDADIDRLWHELQYCNIYFTRLQRRWRDKTKEAGRNRVC